MTEIITTKGAYAEDSSEHIIDDTSKWEVILLDTEEKKQLARLVVYPKTDEENRFLGIIVKDSIKVIKNEIKD